MKALGRLLAACAVLAATGCTGQADEEERDGWSALRSGSPVFSAGGTFARPAPFGFNSRVTVPRIAGSSARPASVPLSEEDGNVWPEPEPPRTTLRDPDAVARGIPNFRPQGRPPQPGQPMPDTTVPPVTTPPVPLPPRQVPVAPAALPDNRPGAVIRRPDGTPAVTGAGTDGVWTYGTPGRPGVGTAFPDGRGGQILVEPGGGTTVAPR